MRIRMRTTAAGPDGSYQAGYEYDVADRIGKAFVKGGYAERVTPPAPEPAPVEAVEPVEDEAAVVEAPEAAVTKPKARLLRGRRRAAQ